jgi:hypothetical protein
MSLVKEWFKSWRSRHVTVVIRRDWPSPGSEYWDQWFRAFCKANASQESCNLASDRVALDPHPWVDGQLKHFLAVLATIRTDTTHATALSREEVIVASRDCPWCDGQGLATVHRLDGQPFEWRTAGGVDVETAERVMACVCAHGRWLQGKHTKAPWPDLQQWREHVAYREEQEIPPWPNHTDWRQHKDRKEIAAPQDDWRAF